jgi:hypothetical protein
MKKISFLLFIGLIFILASCSKSPEVSETIPSGGTSVTPPPSEGVKTINDMTVSSSFDWKTYKNVNFSLAGESDGIIEVVSTNGTIYQKAYLAKGKTFDLNVAIPTYESSVKLKYSGQEKAVDISTGNVSYAFQ